MTPLIIVAPTKQRGEAYVRHQGIAPTKPRVISTTLELRGQRDVLVIAVDRAELAPDLERDLSYLAQSGTTVLNVNSDPLRQAPAEILAVAVAERGVKAYRVRSAINDEDFIVTVTKADTYALPEFEDAEEALAFLEEIEHRKSMRDAHARGIAADRAQRGY